MNIIEVENLKRTYGDVVKTYALKNATFSIKQGEFVTIMGPSGSGKSTLLHMLGCLDRPTSGRYLLQGKELQLYSNDELARIRNQMMGFVFQSFNLLPRMSILENIQLPLIYAGVSEHKRKKIAMEMIELVGLADRGADAEITKLSGGQKQRVAIARALVNRPKVIFADEPTGSLDSKSGAQILSFLKKLNDQGHTVVLVTHESYVAAIAERIFYIIDGKITKDERVKSRNPISDDFNR